MHDDLRSIVRDMISDAIQYHPRCQGFTLQVLSVTPQEKTATFKVTITLSTDISPSLVISYEQHPFNNIYENLYEQLDALRDREFYEEFER